MSERLSELEKHGARYRLNGLPSITRDGEPFMGYIEPRWNLHDLSAEDEAHLGRAVGETLDDPLMVERVKQGHITEAQIYAGVLEHYGIHCPHPPQWRRPWGYGLECLACGCAIAPCCRKAALAEMANESEEPGRHE